jgi:hypothetical protein
MEAPAASILQFQNISLGGKVAGVRSACCVAFISAQIVNFKYIFGSLVAAVFRNNED